MIAIFKGIFRTMIVLYIIIWAIVALLLLTPPFTIIGVLMMRSLIRGVSGMLNAPDKSETPNKIRRTESDGSFIPTGTLDPNQVKHCDGCGAEIAISDKICPECKDFYL